MAGVQLAGVTKEFPGGVRAVDELDLSVADGEFMVLVGPSGCGKTTALRMIAGLEGVTSGTIAIDSRFVNDVPSAKRDIAMVFQNYALYPHMTVFENMAFGLQQRRMARKEIVQRVHEVARLLELESMLKRKPRALSGGQRQRVAMGRAIVRRPAVFLMDEPLSNLDAKLRVQMRAEIRTLQRELGVTTIYVTHDQIEAMTMGDRVAVMRRGVLQQVEPPHQLFHQPVNIFVAGFIGSPAMNLIEAAWTDETLRVGEHRINVGGRLAAIGSGELALGVRPEDVRLGVADGIPGRVLYVEDLGAEVVAHLEIDGVPVATEDVRELVADSDAVSLQELASDARSRRARLIARLPADADVRIGETTRVGFKATKVHLFDLKSGLALDWRAAAGASAVDKAALPILEGEHGT
ncbi:MAG: ABC transporter ATP-binding protein [Gaiellaceae bacterium]